MKKKFILFIAFFLFLFDQLIKYIVVTNMKLFESIKVINKFFYITYVENKGAAFSIFTGQKFFLIFASIIVLMILYFNFIKDKKLDKYEIITYGSLLGGIIGNLFDRIMRGVVVDYLDFIIFKYDAPIFNFADICIVISMTILVLLQLRGEKNEIQNRSTKQ